MRAFREAAIDRYATRIAGELRQQFTAKLEGTGDDQLIQLVHDAIQNAKSYGIMSGADVKRYAEYMVEYGPDFHANQWARPILADSMTGSEKMDALDNHTTFEMRS